MGIKVNDNKLRIPKRPIHAGMNKQSSFVQVCDADLGFQASVRLPAYLSESVEEWTSVILMQNSMRQQLCTTVNEFETRRLCLWSNTQCNLRTHEKDPTQRGDVSDKPTKRHESFLSTTKTNLLCSRR